VTATPSPIVVHTTEPWPSAWTRSLFLAGPSPRTASPVPSWRPRALEVLRQLGFDGVVFVPEPPSGRPWPEDASQSTQWELEALAVADVVAFWVPRDPTHMPGFTTNVEFGAWIGSHKVVLGHPPGAPLTRYLDVLAERVDGQSPAPTLEATLAAALHRMTPGAVRTGAERQVPLHVWTMPAFRDWYATLSRRGRLVRASVDHTSGRGGRVELAIVTVHAEVRGEVTRETRAFTGEGRTIRLRATEMPPPRTSP